MKRPGLKRLWSCLALAAFMAAPALAQGVGDIQSGVASVYSSKLTGRQTASGQIYRPTKLTAAHKTLPYGTKVKVTYEKTLRSVVVRINDRGPMQDDRILDLTPAAARKLGMARHSIGTVSMEILSLGDGERAPGGDEATTQRPQLAQ